MIQSPNQSNSPEDAVRDHRRSHNSVSSYYMVNTQKTIIVDQHMGLRTQEICATLAEEEQILCVYRRMVMPLEDLRRLA